MADETAAQAAENEGMMPVNKAYESLDDYEAAIASSHAFPEDTPETEDNVDDAEFGGEGGA